MCSSLLQSSDCDFSLNLLAPDDHHSRRSTGFRDNGTCGKRLLWPQGLWDMKSAIAVRVYGRLAGQHMPDQQETRLLKIA